MSKKARHVRNLFFCILVGSSWASAQTLSKSTVRPAPGDDGSPPRAGVSERSLPNGCRIRTTRDEDGAELIETVSYDGRTILHSVKTFQDGHRFERRPMPQASREGFFDSNLALLAQLFDAPPDELVKQRRAKASYQEIGKEFDIPFDGLNIDLVTFTDVRGRSTILKEIHDGKSWHIAQVQWPNGLVENSFEWEWVDKEAVSVAWANIKWLNGHGVLIRRLRLNQEEIWRADGSRTLKLLTKRVCMNAAGELQEVEVPQYTVHWSGEGRLVSLAEPPWYAMSATHSLPSQDWQGLDEFITVEDEFGGFYRTGAESDHFRLTTDLKTGALTFKNHRDLTITLKVTGERELKWPKGRVEFDRRGRTTHVYGENEENYHRAYRYPRLAEGRGFEPIEFWRGAHWKYIGRDDASGKQKWELQNGRDEAKTGAKPIVLWDAVRMNPRNTLIIVDGYRQSSYTDDGTTVIRERFLIDDKGEEQPLLTEDGVKRTLTRIAVSDGDKPPAHTLVTGRDGNRQITAQRLVFKDGSQYVRRFGKDEQFLWDKLDARGKRVPGKSFAGLIAIDEDGVLIRRYFKTESTAEQPDSLAVVYSVDEKTPVVDRTIYHYTNGTVEEIHGHGGEVLRDREGDVLRVRYPQGHELHFRYGIADDRDTSKEEEDVEDGKAEDDDAATKKIVAIRVGNQLWVADENEKFQGERDREGKYPYEMDWSVEIERATVKVTFTDSKSGNRTHLHVNGTTHTEFGNGERLTLDPQGRITRYINTSAREIETFRSPSGRLVRVDLYGLSAVVDEDYEPPDDHALPKYVHRSRDLDVHWEDGQPVVSFRRDGVADTHWIEKWWTSSLLSEIRGADGELIYVYLPHGARYVLREHQDELERIGKSGEPVKELELLESSLREESIAFKNLKDVRYVAYGDGRLDQKDEAGRIMSVMTEAKHLYRFTYTNPTGRALSLVQGWTGPMKGETGKARDPNLLLRRDVASGWAFLRQQRREIWLSDFSISGAGDVVIDFAEGPVLREVVCMDTASGLRGRIEVARDGTVTQFAAREERSLGSLKKRLNGEKTGERNLLGMGFVRFPLKYSKKDGSVVEWETHTIKGEDLDRGKVDVSTELHYDGEKLTGFTRTTKPSSGDPDVVTSVTRRGDQWIDNSGRVYTNCRVDKDSKRIILRDASGLVWRLIGTEGDEIEVRFDEKYNRINEVVSDGRGNVLLAGGRRYRTRFIRKTDGAIKAVGSGLDIFVGTNDFGQFISNIRLDDMYFAKVRAEPSGQHVWTGATGIRRIFNDGIVELYYPDGRSVRYSADGESALFRYPPQANLKSVRTARRGGTVVTFTDGRAFRYFSFAKHIDRHRPDGAPGGRMEGTIRVDYHGNVLIGSDARKEFYSLGDRHAAFVAEDDHWRDEQSGEVYASRSELARRIEQLGGQFHAWPHHAHSEWQKSALRFRGISEFQTRDVQASTSDAGETIWNFAAKFAPNFADSDYLTGREGLAPGNPIKQIIQRKNGYITVVLLDDRKIVVEPGQGVVSDDGYVRFITPAKKDVKDHDLLLAYERLTEAGPLGSSSLKLLQTAAQDKHPLAQELLAEAYLNGRGVEPSLEQGISWMLKAGRDDAPRSLFNRGRFGLLSLATEKTEDRPGSSKDYFRRQPEAKIVRDFRKAADGGFNQAKFALAYCLKEGIGAENPDIDAALATYREALLEASVDAKDPLIQVVLAPTTLSAKVWEQAKPWLQQHPDAPDTFYALVSLRAAADDGNAFAKQSLAESGDLVRSVLTPGEPPTFAEMLAAAERGDIKMQLAVAERYFRQNNNYKAKIWFEKAAEQGSKTAQERLVAVRKAMVAAREEQGRTAEKKLKDLPVAIDAPEGLIIAARKGNKFAMFELAKRHHAAKKLKEAQAWLEACDQSSGPVGFPPARNLLREVKRMQGSDPAEPKPKTGGKPPNRKPPGGTTTPAGSTGKVPPHILKRAESGDANTQFSVGMFYKSKAQWEAAKHWFEKAANQGFQPAKLELENIQRQLKEK